MREEVEDYYCRPRDPSSGGPPRSIYEIWEDGGAFRDSVTPSTYCPEYRAHMVLKITSLTNAYGKVFSIGCGNAFVEADLATRGFQVQAIDCNEEAVRLASTKGVHAFTNDFYELASNSPLSKVGLSGFDTLYADGLLGHLYESEGGLDPFFETLLALKPSPGAWIVISNDAPPDSAGEVYPHPLVAGFWLLSREFVSATLARFGFQNWESYHFPYVRPLSGLRNRTICVARVPVAA